MLARRMIRLTTWDSPGKEIDTQYGNITWGAYLDLERNRITKNPVRDTEVRKMGELVSLWVNPVKGCDCDNCRHYFWPKQDLILMSKVKDK